MAKIKSVKAREVLDSRGNPTVEVQLFSKDNSASAIVPSGASKGAREAVEIRDHDSRFHGNGVRNAIQHINEVIAPKIIGLDCADQEKLDNLMLELDGTSNKSKLGANAILAVSMANCRLASLERKLPLYSHIASLCNETQFVLPVPCMNIINGGAHAGNTLSVQEFMIIPVGAPSFCEAVRMCVETYDTLKQLLRHIYNKSATNVGDEGGFAPPIKRTPDAIKLITGAIKENGYEGKIKIGLDVASTQLFDQGFYHIDGEKLSPEQMVSFYENLCKQFPIVSIEDPFEEESFESFAKLTSAIGNDVQIVGDDLLVSNVLRVQKAISEKAGNALLLKPNQIGTVTEAIRAARLASSHDFGVMVSHRSGDSEDTFIADLAVGISSGQIKSGAPCRSERTSKYNQLLRIEEELGSKAIYAGKFFRNPRMAKLKFEG
ncbi:MAG: phosphopyruvate hydratase [Candidatus Woesearchaeota archaeon]